jgi:SNF2 family DNA or RNA helicase
LRFSTAPEDLIDHISRLQERYGFGLHRDALAALDREIDRQVRAKAASRATEADVDVPGLAGTLHTVQRAAVAYLRENRRTLMADEAGLGKTVSAIAAVQDQGAYPVIVLAPAAQVPHWQQESAAWLPDATRVRRFGGTGRWPTGSTMECDRHGDVIVASYEAARENRETLLDLGANAVILDDARFVRNPYAQRTDAATAIAKQADLRLLLTDEPMLNRPQDLIHPLRILDKLDAFGGFGAFTRRYCNAEETRFGLDLSGAANTDELAEKLRRVGYLRRLTQDVQCELPTRSS